MQDLRKEKSPGVAPHAGSVDRNILALMMKKKPLQSLPTRGAWIEIRQSLGSPLFGSGRSPRGERG